jgi:hypothetical protein
MVVDAVLFGPGIYWLTAVYFIAMIIPALAVTGGCTTSVRAEPGS